MRISIIVQVAALFLTLFLLHPEAKLYSQSLKINVKDERKAGDAMVSPVLTAPCMGSRNEPSEDLNWQPLLIPLKIEHENPSPDEELLDSIKAEKQKIKDLLEKQRHNDSERDLSPETYTPVVEKNFVGNIFNGGTPLDNCIAVSDGGIIVSTANTTIRVYDSTGVSIYYKSVLQVINDPTVTTVCDEYVIYDRGADRFIAFAEDASEDYTKTRLFILFSKTNNPAAGGWTYYKLSGNPVPNGYDWFDYPKLAVSGNDLYISGNLFNGSTFDEAAVWQINKADGYSGNASLTYQVWYGFAGNPFTICPVGEGHGNSYGPGCYMICSNSNGGSDIKLYHLTNDLGGSPAPQIIYSDITTAAYSPPADASQMGTSIELKINDSRMMNGFYLNNVIHFVFNSDYQGTGYSGIYYGRLDLDNNTIISGMYGTEYYDYAYPAVASFATSPTDKSVMIGYGYSGSGIYPQMGVINCDDDMFWSNPVIVKQSASYIQDGSSTTTSRWGDYTGISRLNNSDTPSVYIAGSYAPGSTYWDSWIARIGGGNQVIHALDANIYPDPVSTLFQLQFELASASVVTVDIYDIQGRMVKHLYNGMASEGANNFSFNRNNLAQGVYILSLKSNSTTLLNQKIVVEN